MSERAQIVSWLRGFQEAISETTERNSMNLIDRSAMIGAEKAILKAAAAIERGDHLTLKSHEADRAFKEAL